MKTSIRDIAFLLLFVAAPLAFAQRAGAAAHAGIANTAQNGLVEDTARPLTLKATDEQRMAFANCIEATERIRLVLSRMGRIGETWGRGRVGFSRSDLNDLSNYDQQLEAALTNLVTVHRDFRSGLANAQENRLEKHLDKLDRLQAKLNSGGSQIIHDLAVAKPGPDLSNISWDVNAMKAAAGKWHAEHKKIGEEMGIPR